jgi:hypothetical protein
MHDGPLVVFGDDWGRSVSTMQKLFAIIAERRRVVWVNALGLRTPGLGDWRRALQKSMAMIRWRRGADAAPSAHALEAIVHPRALPWHQVRAVHAGNTWSLVRDITAVLRARGIPGRPVLVTGSPPAVGVLVGLGSRRRCTSAWMTS